MEFKKFDPANPQDPTQHSIVKIFKCLMTTHRLAMTCEKFPEDDFGIVALNSIILFFITSIHVLALSVVDKEEVLQVIDNIERSIIMHFNFLRNKINKKSVH